MEPKFFNEKNNTRAEEFRSQVPVNVNLSYETVAPYIAQAELRYVQPLLGDTLCTVLKSYYDGNDRTNTYKNTMLDMIQFAVIRLALWEGFDAVNAMISDTGAATATEKENRLYRYQEENIKKSYKTDGFNMLDTILKYLEDNLIQFPEWESSEYYTALKDSLIRDTATFNSCYPIDMSRLVFLKMKQYVRDVEQITLKHRIGEAFFEELLTADYTELKYKRIMFYIRMYICYKAVAEGIGELHKLPTEKGLIFEHSSADGVEQSVVTNRQLTQTKEYCDSKAENYLDGAISIMLMRHEDYPNFIGFVGNSPSDGVFHRNNTNKKTFFA